VSRRSARLFGTRAGSARGPHGGMAEWLRQGPAKPCTRVRFPLPPRGRLAQRESASLTRKRPQVQILYRPPQVKATPSKIYRGRRGPGGSHSVPAARPLRLGAVLFRTRRSGLPRTTATRAGSTMRSPSHWGLSPGRSRPSCWCSPRWSGRERCHCRRRMPSMTPSTGTARCTAPSVRPGLLRRLRRADRACLVVALGTNAFLGHQLLRHPHRRRPDRAVPGPHHFRAVPRGSAACCSPRSASPSPTGCGSSVRLAHPPSRRRGPRGGRINV
jgi:hypothetical protein